MATRSQSKTSTDHDDIRQWAEARGGRPAVVKSTRGKGDDTGILRIDFPGYSGTGSLEEISWEEFFEKFDREKLALVYQETTARGQKSNFNKIVSRETVTERGARSQSGARKSSNRAGSTGRKRSGTAAKKAPRKTAGAGKGAAARKRTTTGKTSGRKSTGRKAAKRSSPGR
jgi:hypothetical protein